MNARFESASAMSDEAVAGERKRSEIHDRWRKREREKERDGGQGESQVKIDATERDLCVGNAGDRAWKINFQGFPGRRPVGGDLGNGRAF